MYSSFFGGGGGGQPDPYGAQGGGGMGGPPAANNIFIRSFKVYSPAFIGKPEVNKGNKIILPTSALTELARLRISYPMTFMVSNPQMAKKSYGGVLEFSAEEGMCHLPVWMMENLFLEEGSEVILRNVTLNKGTFMKIQPHETKFIDLPDPKAILERELTNYACIFKGDTITIKHGGHDYQINIIDCKPNDQICVIEADVNVDFDVPLDYVEPSRPQAAASGMGAQVSNEQIMEAKKQEIMKMYKRLDGKKLNSKQIDVLLKEYEEARKRELEFDPRQHRLKHGIRNFDPT